MPPGLCFGFAARGGGFVLYTRESNGKKHLKINRKRRMVLVAKRESRRRRYRDHLEQAAGIPPGSVRHLMQDGKWVVPPEERPANWERLWAGI